MANDTRGEIAIELGGRKLMFRVSMGDMKKLKAHFKMPVHGYLAKHGAEIDPDALATIFGYALRDEDGEKVTPEFIDDKIDGANLTECIEKLMQAFGMAPDEIEAAKAKRRADVREGAEAVKREDPTSNPIGAN